MENVVDSNSESDISDSWAVIDDYSCLEWNKISLGIGLEPRQFDFVKSEVGVPRPSSSKGELSDEDSIEVLADDLTDNLSDKEPQVVQDEEWTGADRQESREDICTGTYRLTPDLPYPATQLKKINQKWRESSPILIAILIIGIFGGLGIGYLLASNSYKSEDSTSIQPARAWLTKYDNEIKLLRRQLRSAQSPLKSAVSKSIPDLDKGTKQEQHSNMKENHFKAVYTRMYSTNDFMVKSPLLQNNFSSEFCLASDRPQVNEKVGANNDDNVSVNIAHTSSSSEVHAMKNHLEVNTGVDNYEPNDESTAQNIPCDTNQMDQTFQESSEKVSFECVDSLPLVNTIEELHSSDGIASVSRTSAGNEKNMSNVEGVYDPRPYTKLRTSLERMYTILSLNNNDNQIVLPSQLELLSILPQNIIPLDLSKGHFTATVRDKITRFTSQMQDTTQKLFADIDSSINIFVQHIALKIKEIETFNKQQTCHLRTSLESSADIDFLLDLNREPLFQNCIQEEKQSDHNLVKSKNKCEVKDPLTSSKDLFMPSEMICRSSEPYDQLVKDKNFIRHELKHRNENVQQVDRPMHHFNVEFGETTALFVDKKSSDLHKKSHKTNNNILENKSQLKGSRPTDMPVQPVAGAYHNSKSKNDHSDKKIKPKIVTAAKNVKLAALHSKQGNKKREKSDVKKMFSNKENIYNNESHAKDQKSVNQSSKWVVNTYKTSNVSGEWTMKMANSRAEQRRRNHQSDWVFERSKSRTSNRKKTIKESYWHNHRDSSKFLNSGLCNETMPCKDQASKSWKKVKQRMKKKLWKPFIQSAKLVKHAFNKFHNKVRYHSRQE